jgi:hypothetical protein
MSNLQELFKEPAPVVSPEERELLARAAHGNMVCVRVTKWFKTPKPLESIKTSFDNQNVASKIVKHKLKKFWCVMRVMERETAERMGWMDN